MEKLVVKNQNFEKSINKLDKLSKENEQLPELRTFQEKTGPFKLFSKKVTGQEMNEFGNQIQDNFVLLNERTNKFYKQFIEIYNAFESLDKEYIAGIVGAFNQAIEATKKAEDAQKDIKNTVELIQKAVEKLSEFNKKVSAELSRIDADNWQEKALQHQQELKEIDEKADEIIKTINTYKKTHNQLVKQLEKNRKERKAYLVNLIICWVLLGILAIAVIVLFVLVFVLP